MGWDKHRDFFLSPASSLSDQWPSLFFSYLYLQGDVFPPLILALAALYGVQTRKKGTFPLDENNINASENRIKIGKTLRSRNNWHFGEICHTISEQGLN